ncbi:MAG: transcription elongation factor GreA [Eubacterium sp.]|nr:transcription elongation factor GreA [Eubacterium sp.]
MAETKKHLLTPDGLKELQNELHELEVNQRAEISKKIKEARELGDLSENAEYDAAKDEQRDIEARIEQIKKILNNYELIEEDEAGDATAIKIGSKVKLRDMELKKDMEYKIVGSTEANILKNLISNDSPIGKALIGAKKGETVKVASPAGIIRYKVLSFK